MRQLCFGFGLGFAMLAGLFGLGGCAVSSNSQILTILNQVANTASADLTSQIAIANAATPPDLDGAACGNAALTVGIAMKKVLAATPAGATIGVFSAAEIATLYQPGSAQFNYAVTTLETGCIAKVHDVNQAVNSTQGILTALPTVLALAAPVK